MWMGCKLAYGGSCGGCKWPLRVISVSLRDMVCIQIELDLILTCAKLHGGMVMALVDIVVDVLDPPDRTNAPNVDVAPILPEQKDAERNDPMVINLGTTGESV